MANHTPGAGRSHLSMGAAIAFVAVAALNFRAALPNSTLIHGLGHWVGAIFLEWILIAALFHRRLSSRLVGFQAMGWAYLACRASDTAPTTYWWEDELANWMVRVENGYGLRSVSWRIDRWYVAEVHVRLIQLVVMLLLAWVGGFALKRLFTAAKWPDGDPPLRSPKVGIRA